MVYIYITLGVGILLVILKTLLHPEHLDGQRRDETTATEKYEEAVSNANFLPLTREERVSNYINAHLDKGILMFRITLVLGALALGFFAISTVASAAPLRTVAFQSPTGNIVCIGANSDGPDLQCDRDDGFTVRLLPTGAAQGRQFDPSENFARNQPVFRYGRSWRRGNFGCYISSNALTCASLVSGRGFHFNNYRFTRIRI